MAITIHRLLPDQPSREYYWLFEDRVRDFLRQHLPETNEVAAIQDLREKWIKAPITTGYFLACEDDHPFAHMLSYVADHYGTPYVLFYQGATDQSAFTPQCIRELGDQLRTWIGAYNRILEASYRPERITSAESWSWIEPEMFVRLFRAAGFEIKGERHVFRWSIK